ncbi:MAG: magnesium/cobalt transporter CorA [Proteobacteria bacterium]|nr:magnesium/cobalt transporter CorA [Pseudomonadota bacterium]
MKNVKNRSKKTGLLPGTLIHIGEQKTENSRITLIDYDETQFKEMEISSIEECSSFKDKPTITWINIEGIHDVEVIEKTGQCFNLHPLLLEDILNTDQRPKIEDYDSYIYIVLKMISYDDAHREIKTEQVSLVLGHNYVISFQETGGGVFEYIRDRIRNNKGRIRKLGADYLVYSLIDVIIDNYFIVLEKLGETIDILEEELIRNTKPETLSFLHKLKSEMIFLRRSVWPLRELIGTLERGESALIQKSTRLYLRDVYDHTIQVIDSVETFREMLSGMLDIYLSSIGNKTNEIMKVLTMIATIFIPLTFIVGLYGMNFKFMPELESKWGYPAVLILMAVIAAFMLAYFKRKKWL